MNVYFPPILFAFALFLVNFIDIGKTFLEGGCRTDRYLLVKLYTLKYAGLGNLMFELMGTIALARKLNRTLVVDHRAFREMSNRYPELTYLISELRSNKDISNPISLSSLDRVYYFESYHCCRYNPSWDKIIDARSVVAVNVKFLQSFKYFESLPLSHIRTLVSANETIESIAKDELLDRKMLDGYDHKLCVHSRRGDFLNSYEQAPSTQQFTVPAVHYILEQLKSTTNRTIVVMIGDDLDWQLETSELISNFCLYFWLVLAYLSKGQKVYYNNVYAKGDRFGDNLLPVDFYPNSWISLELTSNRNIRRFPRFSNSL